MTIFSGPSNQWLSTSPAFDQSTAVAPGHATSNAFLLTVSVTNAPHRSEPSGS